MYTIPPSASHAGHRADAWDVEKWLRSVKVKVTSKGDRGSIKLEDVESGELFAECPLPRDVPVSTVVEPVIDSSRYFVLRVEDEASRRHAFIGLGFRERDAASDFKIAIHEHERQNARMEEAAAARAEYERELAEKAAASAARGEAAPVKLHDFSLKGSISITVPGSGGKAAAAGAAGKKDAASTPLAPPRPRAPARRVPGGPHAAAAAVGGRGERDREFFGGRGRVPRRWRSGDGRGRGRRVGVVRRPGGGGGGLGRFPKLKFGRRMYE